MTTTANKKEPTTAHDEPFVERLSERVHFRVTEAEKWVLGQLARQSGLSLGRYVMSVVRAAGTRQVGRVKALIEEMRVREDKEKRRRRRRIKTPPTRAEVLGEFRCPFLRREDARGFERVIRRSARRMGCTELSAARFTSFLFEEIAKEMVSGGVVRVPSFGMFGPHHTPKAKGVDGCLPRFVAGPPLRDFVQWECHPRLNRNRELQAQRRRRRSRRSSVIDGMETFRRHIYKQNRDAQDCFEVWLETPH